MKSFARAAVMVILAAWPAMAGTCLSVSRSSCSAPAFSSTSQRSWFESNALGLSGWSGPISKRVDATTAYAIATRRALSSGDEFTRNVEAASDLLRTANAALVLDGKTAFGLGDRVLAVDDAGYVDALALRGLNGIQAIDNREIFAGAEAGNGARPGLQPLQDPGAPEPVTAGLVGLGLLVIVIAARRKLAAN